MKKILLLLCTLAFVMSNAVGYCVPRYTIQDLGTLGSNMSNAKELNNKGQVVGTSGNTQHDRAFMWSNGVMYDLGSITGGWSHANGINDLGQVVGSTESSTGSEAAFIWDAVNGMRYIPSSVCATDINNAGQILSLTAFGSSLIDKGIVKGTMPGRAWGVNEHGQVMGDNGSQPYLWDNGSITYIPGLGGDFVYGGDLNDYGQVVGMMSNSNGTCHAYVWDAINGTQDLGSSPTEYSDAHDINNAGVIVGVCGFDNNKACLWDNGIYCNLYSLIPSNSGWTALYEATAINDLGQIAGNGYIGGKLHAFLMTPIPEPSSLIALLFGIAGLGGMLRRRK